MNKVIKSSMTAHIYPAIVLANCINNNIQPMIVGVTWTLTPNSIPISGLAFCSFTVKWLKIYRKLSYLAWPVSHQINNSWTLLTWLLLMKSQEGSVTALASSVPSLPGNLTISSFTHRDCIIHAIIPGFVAS